MTPLIVGNPLWLAATNCYVVALDRGGPAVVVDAPPDLEGIAALLTKLDCYPVAALISHGHIDHTGGTRALVESTGVSAYLHPDDDWLAKDPMTQLQSVFGMPVESDEFAPPERFEWLEDGQRLDLGGMTFDVVHTPGHTPGHCCFLMRDEGILFSGDQLFAGSVGRTDLPGGSWEQLIESMKGKILVLDDETDVLPGHGPATTLARERVLNPFLQDL